MLSLSNGRINVPIPEDLPIPSRRFHHLRLSAENRAALEQFVDEWQYRHTFREYGFHVDQTLLFQGLPGNGKTATAEALAGELGLAFEVVNYTQIVHSYVGQTPKAIASQFQRQNQVLLFDECDSIVAKRSFIDEQVGTHARNEAVNQVLKCLDRMAGTLCVVFATNAPHAAIDPALLRRMSHKLTFPPPTPDDCRWLLEQISCRHPMIPEEVIFAAAVDHPSYAECEMQAVQRARAWLMQKLKSGNGRKRK